jgi:hypothetical protein
MDAQLDIFGGETEFVPVGTRPEPAAPSGPAVEQLALIEATPARIRGRRVTRVLYTEPELVDEYDAGDPIQAILARQR